MAKKEENPENTGITYSRGDPRGNIQRNLAEKQYREKKEEELEEWNERRKEKEKLREERQGKRQIYERELSILQNARTMEDKIVELRRLGYGNVSIPDERGGRRNVDLRKAYDTGRENYVWAMYKSTITGVERLVKDPEKESKLARRILQKEEK